MTIHPEEDDREYLAGEALENLRSMLKTAPLAAIHILAGSSKARTSIKLREIAEIFSTGEVAAGTSAAQLILNFYAEEKQQCMKDIAELDYDQAMTKQLLEKWPEFNYEMLKLCGKEEWSTFLHPEKRKWPSP